MIVVENLNKSFNNTQVLFDINIELEKGKANLIIGESGSGKTVFMKCLIGLYRADTGKILFDNREFAVKDGNEKEIYTIRKDMGVVFQGGALFDSFNVLENVIFPLNMFTNMSYKEKLDRAHDCLKRVNLENVDHLSPAEISGGMKKRVAIARAITTNPKYLFCDEPNSGLDPHTSALIDTLIAEITEEYNITTVVNTHDMNSVLQIGDFVNFIYKGQLWWKGNKDNILSNDNKELIDFLNGSELTKRLLINKH